LVSRAVACCGGRHYWLLAGLATFAAQARGLELRLPFTVPYTLLAGLTWQPAGSEGPASFSDGPCRRLSGKGSRLVAREQELHLVTAVATALGVSVLGTCVAPVAWEGTVDAVLEPYIDEHWQLHFRFGETRLLDPDGTRATLLNFIWDLSQGFINRRVETFGFDLGPPRELIGRLLSLTVDPEAQSELGSVLAGQRLEPPQVTGEGIRVLVRLELPATLVSRLRPPPGEQGAPSVERARLQLERLDAFIVAVVKRIAIDGEPVSAFNYDFAVDSALRELFGLPPEAPPPRTPTCGIWVSWRVDRSLTDG
jgi:hypothetical protein